MAASFMYFWSLLFVLMAPVISEQGVSPDKINENPLTLKIGVVGLVHDHVHWILGREQKGDIEIVGIVEPNLALAKRFSDRYGFSMSMVYPTIDDMVRNVRPEAVAAFNPIYDHLSVVEYCAPRGIHVMVEKPFAANLDQARKMIALARKHNIHVLTNYETTWYGSHHKAFSLIHNKNGIGSIRKMVFYTGHQGPEEIGCSLEFLEWLTDPIMNGGGALMDFGCYGANLATWLKKGEHPLAVSCVTQQLKPGIYPKVDDDATIILTYQESQVIIQASWNWPYNRKETEIYGSEGYIKCRNSEEIEILSPMYNEVVKEKAPALSGGWSDPFAFFQRVVKEGYQLSAYDPSSMENNEIVMSILQMAKESAVTGKTLYWKDRLD